MALLSETWSQRGPHSCQEPDMSPMSLPTLGCLLTQLIDQVGQVFSGVSNSDLPKLEMNKRCLKQDCLTALHVFSVTFVQDAQSFLTIHLLILLVIRSLGVSKCKLHRRVINT